LNLFQRVAGAVVGIVLFVLALVFASVILAVVAVLALALWAWLLWRTRNLPRRRTGSGGGNWQTLATLLGGSGLDLGTLQSNGNLDILI